MTTYSRPDKPFYVAVDSLNTFWILNKHMQLHGIVQSAREVTSVSVKATTVVFTQGSSVVFLDADRAELGQTTCKAPRNSVLHSAVFDADTSLILYGLSLESMEVFVFRLAFGNSNTPLECAFVHKFSTGAWL